MQQHLATSSPEYQAKLANEISFYKDCDQVHQLPDIFHYWSNKYLLPKFLKHGFNSPDDFFVQETIKHIKGNPGSKWFNVLSIGAGNGESEIFMAEHLKQQGIHNFSITCLDINPHMLRRCQQTALEHRVSEHIKTVCADFNRWHTDHVYDVVIANQCLHHVLNLEHLFASIHDALDGEGVFLVSDMIGRNGHKRWPEAMRLLQPIWNAFPDRLKYNQLMRRFEPQYINHDCSDSGFEGIRAQDILPLLTKQFNFDLFIPFANLIMVLIDRPFGHNYNTQKESDLAIIDEVHALDEAAIISGQIKPTQMVARLSKQPKPTVLIEDRLTPSFCIREP